jgi:hypothetical protein
MPTIGCDYYPGAVNSNLPPAEDEGSRRAAMARKLAVHLYRKRGVENTLNLDCNYR